MIEIDEGMLINKMQQIGKIIFDVAHSLRTNDNAYDSNLLTNLYNMEYIKKQCINILIANLENNNSPKIKLTKKEKANDTPVMGLEDRYHGMDDMS